MVERGTLFPTSRFRPFLHRLVVHLCTNRAESIYLDTHRLLNSLHLKAAEVNSLIGQRGLYYTAGDRAVMVVTTAISDLSQRLDMTTYPPPPSNSHSGAQTTSAARPAQYGQHDKAVSLSYSSHRAFIVCCWLTPDFK